MIDFHSRLLRKPNDPPFIFGLMPGIACSVCAPTAMDKADIEALVSGLGKAIGADCRWHAIDKAIEYGGLHTPNPCNAAPLHRRHWFLIPGADNA